MNKIGYFKRIKLVMAAIKSSLLLILMISITGYGQADQDKKTIQKMADQFSQLYVKGDYHGMTDIYTPDAVLMSPGQDMIYGREAIYEFWSRDTAYHQVFHRSVSDSLEVVGDFAFDNGYWYSEAVYKGEKRPLASGKYLIIWKKNERGEWRMHHDIWNNRARGWEDKVEIKK